MRRMARLVGVAVVIATLAACGRLAEIGASPAVPTGEPEIMPAWVSCDERPADHGAVSGADAKMLPRLAADFVPTVAIVCRERIAPRPAGGQDVVAEEGRAEDVAALVAALRLPDEPRTTQSCTLELPIVDWFAVLDASGRWVRPGQPWDACGKVRIEVRDAVRALDLTIVSRRTVRTVLTDEAAHAGCGQQWADMVSVETTVNPRPSGRYTADGVRLCVFRVPLSEQGSGKPAGDFESGDVLPAIHWQSIQQALRAAGPVRDCAQHAGRFALLNAVDGTGGSIYVELDGCQRIMTEGLNGPPGFAQGDPALTALLTGSGPQ